MPSATPMMAPEIRKVQKENVVHAASQIQINNPRSRLS
jgi:hypothetical protein